MRWWYMPPSQEQLDKEIEKAELMIRLMVSGGWYHHNEPDYTGRRYVVRDSDMRKGLREEYPDFKIKIRTRKYY